MKTSKNNKRCRHRVLFLCSKCVKLQARLDQVKAAFTGTPEFMGAWWIKLDDGEWVQWPDNGQ